MGILNVKDKPKISIFLVLVLLLQLIVPIAGNMVYADDGGSLGNIFYNPKIEKYVGEDEDGQAIYESLENGSIVELGVKYQLRFDWEIKGNVKADDTASIDIPDVFENFTDAPEQNILVYDINGEEVVVGTYSVNNGKLKFDFNENIEDSTVQEGYVGFLVEFNKNEFGENVEKKIEFKDEKNTTLDIILKPESTGNSIDKMGYPDGLESSNENWDVKEIDWVIELVNTEERSIKNVILEDVIPSGLEYKEGSIEITDLTLNYQGKRIEGNPVSNIESEFDEDGDILTLNLGEIAPYKGYKIKYTTTIIDYEEETFTNNASLSYDGLGDDLIAKATVGNIIRSNPIEKDGDYLGNDIIQWTIDVNKSGNTIEDAKVYDELPEGTILDGDIKIYELIKYGKDWNESLHKTIGDNDFNWPIELGDLGEEDIYRIKFNTKIDYKEINNGEYQSNNEFENHTTLKSRDIDVGKADKMVEVERDPILEKIGESQVDYNNKTIEWTIHVNQAGHDIYNAIVTDILGEGMTVTAGDIEIYDSEDNEIEIDIDNITINNTSGDGKTEITIDLGNIGTGYRKIVYKATINNDALDMSSYENTADLTGDGIGEGEDGIENPEPVVPNSNSFSKDHIETDYNGKTMSWKLTINPIKEQITELKIIDSFPNKGLILLLEDFEVKQGDVELTLNTHYTLQPFVEVVDGENVAGYHKGFILEFTGTALPLNALTTIEYKTSFDPQKEVEDNFLEKNITSTREYKNKARFEWKTNTGDKVPVEKEAKDTLKTVAWNSGKKLGKLVSVDSKDEIKKGWISGNTRQIEWEVYINYLEQDLGDGVFVEDILDYTGEIIKDSIEVKRYNVSSNSNTSVIEDSSLTEGEGEDYTVGLIESGKGFKLTFNNTVEERYVIIFRTSVPDISEYTYTNNATLETSNEDKYPYSQSVTFNDWNKQLSKSSDTSNNQVYTDSEINWEIKINESLSVINDAKIVDRICSGLVYIFDSIKLYKLEGTTKVLLNEGIDNDYTLTISEDQKEFIIEFNDKAIDSAYILEYKTIVIATSGTKVNNSVEYTGYGEEPILDKVENIEVQQFSFVGGIRNPNSGDIIITKIDLETGETIENNPTEFELYYYLNDDESTEYIVTGESQFTITNDIGDLVGGQLGFGNLPYRTYYLREVNPPNGYKVITEAPEGYVLNNKGDIVIVVDSNGSKKVNIEIPNTKIKTEVTATKEWINGPGNNRPEVQLELYRQIGDSDQVKVDNSLITLNGTEEPAWTYTWENLDLTDINGTEYEYSVLEVDVPENYEVSYGVDDEEEEVLVVTNSYIIPTNGTAKATKNWVKGDKLERPTIWFKLYRSIEEGELEEVPNANIQELADRTVDQTVEVTWTNLEESDIDGNPYTFYVKEVDGDGNEFEPENYKKEESDLKVTNTYESPKIDIDVKKVWENGPKPSIQLKLFRQTIEEIEDQQGNPEVILGDLEEVEDSLITLDGEEVIPWTHTWEDLDKTDEEGLEYLYSVEEVNVPENYEESYSTDEDDGSLVVTNQYIIPKTNITIKKEWIGGKERPEIEIQLYRQIEDGELEEVEDALVTLDGAEKVPWTYTWEGLDRTDIDGNEYIYIAKEVGDIENYNPNYDQGEDGSLLVTNTYESPKATFTATKTWIGGPKDKPTIELQLFRNGDAFGKPVKLANGQTTYTWEVDWTDENGVEYVYTVDEVNIPKGYAKYVDKDGRTIYNVHKDIVGEDKEGEELTDEEFEKIFDPDEPVGPGGLPKTGFNDLMFTLFLIGGLFILSLGVVLYRRFS